MVNRNDRRLRTVPLTSTPTTSRPRISRLPFRDRHIREFADCAKRDSKIDRSGQPIANSNGSSFLVRAAGASNETKREEPNVRVRPEAGGGDTSMLASPSDDDGPRLKSRTVPIVEPEQTEQSTTRLVKS